MRGIFRDSFWPILIFVFGFLTILWVCFINFAIKNAPKEVPGIEAMERQSNHLESPTL